MPRPTFLLQVRHARGATTCLPDCTLSHHHVCHTSQVAKTPEHVTGSGERFFGSGSTASSPGRVLSAALIPPTCCSIIMYQTLASRPHMDSHAHTR